MSTYRVMMTLSCLARRPWRAGTLAARSLTRPVCELLAILTCLPSIDQISNDLTFSTKFEPALEAIKSSGLTGAQLLEAARPSSPCAWLGLILLLDQVPRNCYRGASSRFVFTVFDPLALAVAQAAVAAGVPHTAPEIRWRPAYRSWFYLPFEHSEDLAMHDECRAQYEGLARDVEALLAEEDEESAGDDEYRRHAWRVVHKDEKAARALVAAQLDFARRHDDIIRKFGRYPHRNGPLGRETTAEEKAFLEGGGDTFTQK